MPSAQRTFRLKAVCTLTTLHRSSVKRKVDNGTFPPPMMEGRNPVWHEVDLIAYQNDLRAKAGLPALEELERLADESPRSAPALEAAGERIPRQAAHPPP
jgi:predicted DNA-binding transcriptional regulator AlpA